MQPRIPRQSGLLLLLAAVLALLLVGGLSIDAWNEYNQNVAAIHHSRQILDLTDSLFGDLRDAETAERGYLLTGQDLYLRPYEQARRIVPDEVRRLQAELPAEREQRQRAQGLSALVNEEVNALDEAIRQRASITLSAEAMTAHAGSSNRIMLALRSSLAAIRQAENTRWAALMRRRDTLSSKTQGIGLIGSGILAILLMAALLMLWRGANQRERLIVALNSSHEAVERVRELLQTTLYSIGDGVITTDTNGFVTRMNFVAERLTGWRESEARALHITEVLRIEDEATGQPAPSLIDIVLQTGEAAAREDRSLLISKSGQAIPIDDSASPIREANETRGVVLVLRDVTARKKAEAQLRESEERFRTMADAAPVFIWLFDANQLCTYVNKPWLDFTGRPLNDELGIGWMQSIHPDDSSGVLDTYSQSFQERRPFSTEYRLRRHDGVFRWVLTNGIPRFDRQGAFVGYIGSSIDVDERRQNEEKLRQSAKLESLGVLAGGIAHDFNNILVGILANASLIEDYIPDDPEARDIVSSLTAAGERAARLTHQMLAYSGRGRFVIQHLNLSEQIRQIMGLVHASIPKTVDVQLQLMEPLPPILADASQVQQVIMNLLINAAEAIAPQAGTVRVSTAEIWLDEAFLKSYGLADNLAPGIYVEFRVTDTGIGMDADTQAKMFDPFFSTKFTGRGLGLAAVQGIVRGHKGAIHVDSVHGQGTTFRVYLPSSKPAERAGLQTPEALVGRKEPARGAVLIADDEEMVRKIAGVILEKLGYRVLQAENGVQALECFRQHADAIQLVLLDMTMPLMNGEEVLVRLRSNGHRVKVIASSGYSEAEAVARFGNQIDGFLQKPYTASQVASTLKSVLDPNPLT
jgi:PAS domain S-box-containing protein